MRAVAVAVLILLGAGSCFVETNRAAPNQDFRSIHLPLRELSVVEEEFLLLLNEYRRENGRAEVYADRALNQGAFEYAEKMGLESFFSHESPDGTTFDSRMCQAGYDPACGPSTAIGENIAAGQETAYEVFEAWRKSPGHDRNMLDEDFVVVGLGFAEVPGSDYGVYWTNTFGGEITSNTVLPDEGSSEDAGLPTGEDIDDDDPVTSSGDGDSEELDPESGESEEDGLDSEEGGDEGADTFAATGCAIASENDFAASTALWLPALAAWIVSRKRKT